jgi:hypothetical protein
MFADRQKTLSEKLTANQQRRWARLFVNIVSPCLREVLSNARIVFVPESESIAWHHFVCKRGVGRDNIVMPADFFYEVFEQPKEMFAALPTYRKNVDSQIGYFCPTRFWPLESRSGGEPPLFEINFGWAREHFSELFEPSGQACSLTTKHGEAGIVTSTFCDCGRENPDEPIIEVGYWGHL